MRTCCVNFGTERHTTVKVRESDTVWHRFTLSLSTRSWTGRRTAIRSSR